MKTRYAIAVTDPPGVFVFSREGFTHGATVAEAKALHQRRHGPAEKTQLINHRVTRADAAVIMLYVMGRIKECTE